MCVSWPCSAVTPGTIPFSAKWTLPRGPRGSSVQASFSHWGICMHTCVRCPRHKDTVHMSSVSKLLWEARVPSSESQVACSLGGQSSVCLPGPGAQAGGSRDASRPAETSLVLANFCPQREGLGTSGECVDRGSKCSKSLAMTSTGGVPSAPRGQGLSQKLHGYGFWPSLLAEGTLQILRKAAHPRPFVRASTPQGSAWVPELRAPDRGLLGNAIQALASQTLSWKSSYGFS